MIVEERMYTLHPGKLKQFLTLVETEGLCIQKDYIGTPLGYFTTETGELNKVVHLWMFDDMASREHRRAKLGCDPRWLAFTEKVLPLIVHMENRLLTPTSFSAIGNPRLEK